jgi:hypothetical protein
MKKILGLFLVFIFVQTGFASQLIFKTVLDTKAGLLSETPKLSTSNFRQLRIFIKREQKSDQVDEDDYFFANIYAMDDERELLLLQSDKNYSSFNMIFEVPPSVTKISVTGQGKFYIYVWAS